MKTQPTIIRIITLAMCICMMACCSKSVEPEPEPTKPTLSFSPSGPITFTAGGGQQRIIVTTNQAEWRAWTNQEWCHIDNDGFDLVIYANENTSQSDMPSATVSVEVGEAGNILTKTVTVNQKGKQEEPDPETTHITTQGGTVKFDNLRIVVPEGGFMKDADVHVEKVSSIMGDYAASQYYLVTLPADFAKNLTLKLSADDGVTGEVFASIMSEGWAKSINEASPTNSIIKTTAESDGYSAIIEPFENSDNEDRTAELVVGLVQGYSSIRSSSNTKSSTSDNKFQISFPTVLADQAYYIQDWLEEAYYNLTNLGFKLDWRTRRIEVEYYEFTGTNSQYFGYFTQSKLSDNYSTISLNASYFNDKTEIKKSIVHELCHLSQSYYSTNSCFMKAISGGDFLWMDEAVAVWAENTVNSNVSKVQNDNLMEPLTSFNVMNGGNVQDHGYGMAALIQWLSNEYPGLRVVGLHEQQKKGATSYYDAFNKAFPDCFFMYTMFFDSYILGEIYPEYNSGQLFLANQASNSSKLRINDWEVTSMTRTLQPYSAQIFRIEISVEDIKELSDGTSLTITASGADAFNRLLKFDSKTKKVVDVGAVTDTYTIADAKGMAIDRDIYYVVSYNTSWEVKDATVSAFLQEVGWSDIDLYLGDVSMLVTDAYGEHIVNNTFVGIGTGYDARSYEKGTISKDGERIIFTNNWESTQGSNHSIYSVRLLINPKTKIIEKGHIEVEVTDTYTSKKDFTTSSFDIHNIPYTCSYSEERAEDYSVTFSETTPVSNHISNVKYEHTTYDGTIYTFLSNTGNDGYVSVYLYYE